MRTLFQPPKDPWPGSHTFFALLAGVFLLTGCLSRPSLKIQTFSFDSPSLSPKNSGASQPVLEIKKVEIDPPFEDRTFVYRTDEFTYQRDPYAGFLDTPEAELLARVRAGLAAQGNFSAVIGTGSAQKPDTLVEISIRQLYGDFREPTRARAVLTVHFAFFMAANGVATKSLFQKEYSRSVPLKVPSAVSLMKGWDRALTGIIEEAVADFNQAKSAESTH